MAKILGTAGNDTLSGTGEADAIEGLAGDDRLSGGTGDDTLLGGDGSDQLFGEAGNDTLEGGDGFDYLVGGAGDDIIRGGADNDTIDSQSDSGSDLIYGDGGNDNLWLTRSFSTSADTVTAFGGNGDDYISVQFTGGNAAVIDAGAGADSVRLAAESRTLLTLGLGRDVLTLGGNQSTSAEIAITDFDVGAAGDRIEWDEFLNYKLVGWDKATNPFATGHLKLVQSGTDALLQIDADAGGTGSGFTTLIRFQDRDASSLTPENLDGYPSDGSTPAGANIRGTEGNDTLTGTGGADVIEGLGGNDTLTGAGGNDIIRGGDGADRLMGEAGDDTLEGGAGEDSLTGGSGNDRVFGGGDRDYISDQDGGSDALFGDGGDDYIDISRGGSGLDAIVAEGGDGADQIRVKLYGLQTVRVDAGAGDDRVRIGSNTETTIALGTGRDVLEFEGYFDYKMTLVLTDFEAGATGDRLDWDRYLGERLTNWDPNGNPFASGHLKLVQSGADTLLLFDRDGSGMASTAITLITFRNLDATTLTAENLGGFPADGSVPAGVYFAGTAGFDRIEGTGGADLIEGFDDQDFLDGGAGADTLRGGNGNDQINGQLGDDVLEGGDGNDFLDGGFGSDRIYGGAGDDSFNDFRTTGSDQLFGEDGDDSFTIQRFSESSSGDHITIDGGNGNDRVNASLSGGHTLTIDLGDGDDVFTLSTSKSTTVTLGAGRDLYELHPYYYQNAATTITDFEAGPSGDRLELSRLLDFSTQNWNASTNPFVSGHLRLLQDGADTLLVLDSDGAPNGYANYMLVRFSNVSITDLTADNLDGYDPFTARATDGADTLTGNAANDLIAGGAGDDFFLLQQGGNDTAFGGAGNDGFYFGAAMTRADRVDGGAGGDDQVALQGAYSGLTLGEGSLRGVETLVLLSGADARFGDTSDASYSYAITAEDGLIAAGDLLTVNMNGLRAGENVTFNGAAESDGAFLFFGGAGRDVLTGGAQSDGFYFGAGLFGSGDRLVGGAGGGDQLGLQGDYAGVNAIVFGASQLSGIESIVVLGGADTRFGGRAGGSNAYDLTLNDGNVAGGATLTINGNTLGAGETLRVNGAAETNGILRIFGGDGADVLTGGGRADTIFGGAGDDRITGGQGADQLTGGAGNDIFVYLSTGDSLALARDVIGGFAGGDRIDLSGIDARTGTAANDAFSFIGAGAFTGASGELRAVLANGVWSVEGDTNGDRVADLVIQVGTDGGYALDAGDFNF